MTRTRLLLALASVVICGGSLLGAHGQSSSSTVEEQLRKQYSLTSVGADGVVARAGTVLTVQADGMRANPASDEIYWPNHYKNGDKRVKQSLFVAKAGISKVKEVHVFQVGEKLYITNIVLKDADIIFSLQSCGTCGGSAGDSNNVPFRAELSFQLGRGYLNNGDLKQIQETIGQVLVIDRAATSAASQIPPPSAQPVAVAQPVVSLKLPSSYVSDQAPADKLQLNADKSFSLLENGQSYHGTFVPSGDRLELTINETGTATVVTLRGNSLTDSSGHTWTLRETAIPPESVLRNQDIVDLSKAKIDDATILAKIEASKCQFDTSTGALIQLKQNGVSAPVIKAMISTK